MFEILLKTLDVN